MAGLPGSSVRRLDEEAVARLRTRTARQGVSMEGEIRSILRDSGSAPNRLTDLATEIFGPDHGIDLDAGVAAARSPPAAGPAE